MRLLGIGFRAAATCASLQEVLAQVLAQSEGEIGAIVTEAAKAREEVFRGFAQALGVPGLGITAAELAQMITPTQSARIQDRFGTGSLAEAAALAAAGPRARLVVSRVVSSDGMATGALAEAEAED
ncbi:MAG: cobalamin biosynthesis protein [Pseudomonadota bacterium]